MTTVHALQTRLGVTFRDERLLWQALTHPTYINEVADAEAITDNQRLEFLGDAVLGFVVADWLFASDPAMREGDMTKRLSALVDAPSLAHLGAQLGLGAALRLGKGEERNGGRERQSILEAAFEAVVGALYVDQGLDAVRALVLPLMRPLLVQVLAEARHEDVRTLLQERIQAAQNQTPHYRTVAVEGPEHDPLFTVEVLVGDVVLGQGQGRSKRAAAKDAARAVLDRMNGDLGTP